jgi:prepilin-type N-terminal cleavage/methylation domain-containing protein
MKFKRNKGITLVELLVVILIIGILSSIGLYSYKNFTSLGKRNVTIENHNTAVNFITASFLRCHDPKNYFQVKSSGVFSGQQPCSTALEDLPSIFQSHFANESFNNSYNKKFSQFEILDTPEPPLGVTLLSFSSELKILRLTTKFSQEEDILLTDIKDTR